MSGIIECLSFCVWLISLSIMSSRFIHIAACVRISFLFKAEKYSIVWLCMPHFAYSFISGHLGCLHSSVIVNNAAMNMVYTVHLYFWTLSLGPLCDIQGLTFRRML